MRKHFFPKARNYVDLVLQVGVNLQAGQRLLVTGSIFRGVDLRLAWLVEMLTERAYELGASHVDVIWNDPTLDLMWLHHIEQQSITIYPRWFGNALLEHFKAGDAFLMLYSEDPDLFAGVDTQVIGKAMSAMRDPVQEARNYIHHDAINWTVASAPIPPWSARVLPDIAVNRRDQELWKLILTACRLNTSDPLNTWRDHLEQLAGRARRLNERQYASLVFSAEGTDLRVGLPEGHIWQGGQSVAGNGIPFVANLPTEEIFTLPHKDQVEGKIRTSRPLQYGGKKIEELTLVFVKGRVVEYWAKTGADVLEELIQTDEGACRLGEIALVPQSSPLARCGVVFHNILYDENAGTHLALGSALRVSLRGADEMSDEEFCQRGGNLSRIHYDFTIGSETMNVYGITCDGKQEMIMENGEWQFWV